MTSGDGAYAWDVPVGWWQVRFEKEGYQQTATQWMRVPPPRMNLVTAMTSFRAPEVASAKAYPDYIEVIFSQFMDIRAEMTLSEGMDGTWQQVENACSRVLHIKKAGGFVSGESASFMLKGARNYAGTVLPDYSSDVLTVSACPALSYGRTAFCSIQE